MRSLFTAAKLFQGGAGPDSPDSPPINAPDNRPAANLALRAARDRLSPDLLGRNFEDFGSASKLQASRFYEPLVQLTHSHDALWKTFPLQATTHIDCADSPFVHHNSFAPTNFSKRCRLWPAMFRGFRKCSFPIIPRFKCNFVSNFSGMHHQSKRFPRIQSSSRNCSRRFAGPVCRCCSNAWRPGNWIALSGISLCIRLPCCLCRCSASSGSA